MKLKYKYARKDEVPAHLASHYTENNGTYTLDLDGAVDASQADEFRNLNTSLQQQMEDLHSRLTAADPFLARKLLADKFAAQEASLLAAGRIDQAFDLRTAKLKADLSAKAAEAERQRDALAAELEAVRISQTLSTAASKRGAKPAALVDLTARARGVLRWVSGEPRVVEPDGATVRPGKDGTAPMTLDEWLSTQMTEAPHLFESSSGSGAPGTGPGIMPGRNPFNRGPEFNLTEQMKLIRTDPQLAANLKASANAI